MTKKQGFYGVSSLKQAQALMKPLYKYEMAEYADKEGFNAGEIQNYISEYMRDNGIEMIDSLLDAPKKSKNKKSVFSLEELLTIPKFWSKMAMSIGGHYNVELKDMKKVAKGLALIAWFMAQDWDEMKRDDGKMFDAGVREHGYNQYMAMSYAFWMMADTKKYGKFKP
tara:strand:+ start:759 stop:1262 length:504 start_codon:yes stop_codon:yes gene_type:complete